MELSNAKGTRDYLPEQQILRNKIVDALKSMFERYGYAPLETPVLEKLDVLSSKYAGGAEILKEVFTLEDQGGRKLGLRYDLTVPLCRVIAMNPNMKMPFKRYEIGKTWRDGPIALGRYREFTQCDIDVIGCKAMTADAEIIYLIEDVFRELGLACVIKINNRKLLNGIIDYANIPKTKAEAVILAVDKLDKQSKKEVVKELENLGLTIVQIDCLFDVLEIEGGNSEVLDKVKKCITNEAGREGINEIEELLEYTKGLKNIELSFGLARGLSYYTGTVIETFLVGSEIKSAVCSGGRYDQIISRFLDAEKEYPAIGVSFGVDRIYDALAGSSIRPKTKTQLFVIPIKTFQESYVIAEKFRKAGINAEIDLLGKGISKNLDYANSMKIPFVIFVGEDELREKKVKLRNMDSGKEELDSVEEIIKKLKE